MAVTIDGVGTVNGVTLPTTGFGKVLQVVRATDTTRRSTTSTSYVDASLSVTITPQKIDSALILIYSGYLSPSNGSLNFMNVQITDASNVAISGAQNGTSGARIASNMYMQTQLFGYVLPSTLSAVTYKIRFSVSSGTTGFIENDQTTGQLYAIEVSA